MSTERERRLFARFWPDRTENNAERSGENPVVAPAPPPEGWTSRNETLSYHTYAAENIAATQLALTESAQNTLARLIRMEGRSAANPLRVLFLVPHIALFDAYDALCHAMTKDPAFAPEILAFKRQDIMHDVTEAETRSFFESEGIPAHIAGFDERADLPDIDPDAYDVLFYTLGTLAYPQQYRIENTSKHFLTCYLAYGILLGDQAELQFNQPAHHAAWRIYASTPRDKFFYDQNAKRQAANARLTGYPKFDLYRQPPTENTAQRPAVVWAPHWTIGLIYPNLNMGVFDRICMEMLTIMDEYPQIDFIYRPHPNLQYALETTTFMNAESYGIYLDMLRARPNCRIWQRGDNIKLFATSAGMITDSVSFLAEYLPSHKPLLFLDRADRARLNEQGEAIASLHHKGLDAASIRKFLTDVILDGNDPRRPERRAAAEAMFEIHPGGATAAIMDDLRSALLDRAPQRRTLGIAMQDAARRSAETAARAQEASTGYWLRQSAYNYATIFPDRYQKQTEFTEQHFLPLLTAQSTVIDIGCADGWSSVQAAKVAGQLKGYDLSPAFIELAKRNAAAAGLSNCKFEVADALELKLDCNSYDAAILGGLLTCIVDDEKAASILKKVADSLKPGAPLLLKDTLHRGSGARLNFSASYAAIYRDVPQYQSLVKNAGFALGATGWIQTQDEHGSYMMLATKSGPSSP